MTVRIESNPKEPVQRPSRRIIFLYHELRISGSPYSYATEVRLFEQHADLFMRLRAENNFDLWPELTFDDGHISNYELAAPILQSRGLTAQLFITAGWTGLKPGYMGWSELRALLDAGFLIGAHGWSHSLLTHCNNDELKLELDKSKFTLEDRLGISITRISLPGGRYNRRVLDACEEAGYRRIYTSEPRVESVPFGSTVGRLNVLGSMQPEWIAKLFEPKSRVLSSLGRRHQMKEVAKKLLGDRLYGRLWAQVNRQNPEVVGDEDVAE
jgi:hypothetical protein